jgi:hypothetical protein
MRRPCAPARIEPPPTRSASPHPLGPLPRAAPQTLLLLDLRSPLGVAPAALSPLGPLVALPVPSGGVALRTHKPLPDSLLVARAFQEKRAAAARGCLTTRFQTTCVQVRPPHTPPPPCSAARRACVLRQRRLVSGACSGSTADVLLLPLTDRPCILPLERLLPPQPAPPPPRHPTPPGAQFQRIWWDKYAKHPSATRVAFWQPLPPPGYVALGDCLVAGAYCPPRGVVVLREEQPLGSERGGPPLLARPVGYYQVGGGRQRGCSGPAIARR